MSPRRNNSPSRRQTDRALKGETWAGDEPGTRRDLSIEQLALADDAVQLGERRGLADAAVIEHGHDAASFPICSKRDGGTLATEPTRKTMSKGAWLGSPAAGSSLTTTAALSIPARPAASRRPAPPPPARRGSPSPLSGIARRRHSRWSSRSPARHPPRAPRLLDQAGENHRLDQPAAVRQRQILVGISHTAQRLGQEPLAEISAMASSTFGSSTRLGRSWLLTMFNRARA